MSPDNPDLNAVYAGTQHVYEAHAADWDRSRPRAFLERDWLDRFLDLAPGDAHILDLGCGAGEPMAGHVLGRGFELTGVDYAPAMLALARARYPGANWRDMDLRAPDFAAQYDGAYSWDGSFHLKPDEQRRLIAALSNHLTPGAPLMLTVGPNAGEVTGTVAGCQVYHSSLAPDDYAATLDTHGFDLVELRTEDPDCDLRSVLLARRRDRRS